MNFLFWRDTPRRTRFLFAPTDLLMVTFYVTQFALSLRPWFNDTGRGSRRKAADLFVLQAVLDLALQAHPERFVRKPPTPPTLPIAVWINEPFDKETSP